MHSFDDLPLAFWTSTVSTADATVDRDEDDNDRASCRLRLREAGWAMRDWDAWMMRRAETRNAIEARILKLRLARGGRHGGLLPSTDKFAAHLDSADGWLFSDESNDARPEEMESRLEKDWEMEEGARAAAAKRTAAKGGGGRRQGQ